MKQHQELTLLLFSSWSFNSSKRFFAISASTYLPCRSQFFRCSSKISKKSWTAASSFGSMAISQLQSPWKSNRQIMCDKLWYLFPVLGQRARLSSSSKIVVAAAASIFGKRCPHWHAFRRTTRTCKLYDIVAVCLLLRMYKRQNWVWESGHCWDPGMTAPPTAQTWSMWNVAYTVFFWKSYLLLVILTVRVHWTSSDWTLTRRHWTWGPEQGTKRKNHVSWMIKAFRPPEPLFAENQAISYALALQFSLPNVF